MAEVEKVSAATVAMTATPADIPASAVGSVSDAVGSSIVEAGAACNIELGTSPTQERSSNSHPHDSEYDTASDLEGGEDYDDDDDELDESMTDGDGESMTDDEEDEDDDEREDPSMGIEKTDVEAQKKVDEDRSNPQYIPKRGTFYEHDDRTADVEGDGVAVDGENRGDIVESATNGVKSSQSPTISQASKTMKKWQPASGVERWSHDRFDASEQAPKSRTELVSAYGYDIRTEDAPPRARRRRRYGRGPSKYLRNWEDENAYLKASNKERKPPRPSDFPALNERDTKQRKPIRSTREEKENRIEKRQTAMVNNVNVGEKSGAGNSGGTQRPDERRGRSDGKNGKNKNYGRQNAPVGRQAAMEFKQKQRTGGQTQQQNNHFESQQDRHLNRQSNIQGVNMNDSQKGGSSGINSNNNNSKTNQYNAKHGAQQLQQNEMYNNSNNGKGNDHAYQMQMQQQLQSTSQQQQQQPQQQQQIVNMRPAAPKTMPPSNLSQRLQQVQHRNDPSHVGSVQMHALATQNQLVGQQQQQQQQQAAVAAAAILLSPQQQPQQLPQEQRGPPKRYSSLRRSQHEAQHQLVTEQHQLQQLQQLQQQPPLLLQDQHMLQANLMQLYHQENLVQMQALQVSQAQTASPKQPAYATVPPTAQPQPYGAAAGTAATPASYYVTAAAPDAYAATTPQQAPTYLPPTQAPAATAATLAYATAAPSTATAQQSVPPGAAPTAYGPAAPVPVAVPPTAATGATAQATSNTSQNYPNYQNYNTVGGTTYFVPPAQATTRPVVLPQRRPTNAIPILPPSEKNKQQQQQQQRATDAKDDAKNGIATLQSSAPIGSAENIDHIIDNMFVQRPAFQPPPTTTAQTRKSSSPLSVDSNAPSNTTSDNNASTATVPTQPVDDATLSNGAVSNSIGATTSAPAITNAAEKSSSNVETSGGGVDNANSSNNNNNASAAPAAPE